MPRLGIDRLCSGAGGHQSAVDRSCWPVGPLGRKDGLLGGFPKLAKSKEKKVARPPSQGVLRREGRGQGSSPFPGWRSGAPASHPRAPGSPAFPAYRGSKGRARLPPQDAQYRGLRGRCQELQQPQLGPRLGKGYRGHHAGRCQDLAQTSGQRRGVPGGGRDGHQIQTQVVRQPRCGDGQGGQDAGAGGGRAGQERS